MKVAGVIYCHNIVEPRWSGSAQENFKLFKKLCGPAAARNTAIFTTRWNVPKDIAPLKDMEDELKTTHWKNIIAASGAAVHRDTDGYQDTVDSLLIKNAQYEPLQIQKKLVDRNMSIHKSGVAEMLFIQLLQSLKLHKGEVAKLKAGGGDQADIAIVEAKVNGIVEELKSFAVTLPRKLVLLLTSFSKYSFTWYHLAHWELSFNPLSFNK